MTAEAVQLAKPRTQPLRLAVWCSGPAAIATAHFVLIEAHPIVRMWVFVGLLFFWMKAVVLAEYHAADKAFPPFARLITWIVLWPGMRPGKVSQRPWNQEWVTPLGHGTAAIIGACFVLCAGYLVAGMLWSTYALVPFVMVAFSLVVHFGLFGLLTAAWRAAGFKAGPLFRNPFATRSLNDFWTHRWNLAYVEMCQETVLRAFKAVKPKPAMPMAGCSTAKPHRNEGDSGLIPGLASRALVSRSDLATGAIFLFSGLLHEVAISLPVNAGYGLPMLYFALNGGAMLIGRKFREGGIAARAWAVFWVIAPLPLLFHPWFIRGLLLPMVGVNP